MTHGQPGDGENLEIIKAMPTSVARLHGQAQRLIDELGPTPYPDADSHDSITRGYEFPAGVVTAAGFEVGTKAWITDVMPDGDEDDDDSVPAHVVLYSRHEAGGVLHARDTGLEMLTDGSIIAQQPIDIVRSQPKSRAESMEELALRILGFVAPLTGPEFFSQAECDQWLKLITLEFARHGRE